MQTVKISLRYGVILGVIALICTALSAAVYFLTKAPITQAIANQQAELLAQIIPPQSYDNDLLTSCDEPHFAQAKTLRIEKICVVEKNHQPVAYAYETIAPDGYSGNIRFLVGITPQGEVLGLRVLEHKETPGLGDKIELRISDWVLSFNHKKISTDNLNDWAVKKDGGQFDQFTGATITPRAIVNQIKRSALPLLQQMKVNAVKEEQN
ncbi:MULTISPECIES: electron transport complex subunit RsxG [unclassified Avibacterium]|uniref:electron transport complex subunit RsxG n=1 Tax=unclassified Avibacterium TaxID=2685287 RepID=UPI002026DA98|nr:MULTISPECIES: electron transport complex subunit RsxG [unclassified Avibacterium]MCW9697911.1 electron transport complex subunit RsxG [Avibacterium sp. 20-129]URL05760.1 electron transport complex subunit RsxG [Avibacterium sp. 21-595]